MKNKTTARAAAALRALGAMALAMLLAACAAGPQALQASRLQYNEVIKSSTEQQLLLNIVRLRYTDTPSSLSVSNIAAQFELVRQLQLTPFFAPSGAEPNRSYSSILPGAAISSADRPTFSLTPIDDAEFTRKLFTPLTLEGVIYLANTTWPIGTVFRLYLENLNWVPNAELASGPTPARAPPYSSFVYGVLALQQLQQDGRVRFATEERFEPAGSPIPAAKVDAADVIEAAKSGFELRRDEGAATWTLGKRTRQPVLFLDPKVKDTDAARVFTRAFHLKPGVFKYDVTVDGLPPYSEEADGQGGTLLDLEPRSLLQAMYFVSHGVDVPPEHSASGLARTTLTDDGSVFNWKDVTFNLFHVQWKKGSEPPKNAHVAVRYHDYWFYIDDADHDTKATFSLLMELTRLDLQGKQGDQPILTLPLGR
ncbi:MAG TPA: hypothetical protein VGN52_25420 [Burkholderiales bacterium]